MLITKKALLSIKKKVRVSRISKFLVIKCHAILSALQVFIFTLITQLFGKLHSDLPFVEFSLHIHYSSNVWGQKDLKN